MRRAVDNLRAHHEHGGRHVCTVRHVVPHDDGHHRLQLKLCLQLTQPANVLHLLTPKRRETPYSRV